MCLHLGEKRMGDLSGLHNRMHFDTAGDAEWNSTRWLYCIIFMVAEFSCFCLVLFAAVSHTLFVGQTLETQNAPLAAAGRSGWVWRGAWLQSTVGHRSMTRLTLPISCPASRLGDCDLLFILSADKAGDGRRSPLFSAVKKSNLGTVHLFTLREGSTPAALQVSPILSSPWPTACLSKGLVSTGESLHPMCQILVTPQLCMVYVIWSCFQSHLVWSQDCQNHFSRNRISSGNRPLWKYPYIYKRHTILFLWKVSYCH